MYPGSAETTASPPSRHRLRQLPRVCPALPVRSRTRSGANQGFASLNHTEGASEFWQGRGVGRAGLEPATAKLHRVAPATPRCSNQLSYPPKSPPNIPVVPVPIAAGTERWTTTPAGTLQSGRTWRVTGDCSGEGWHRTTTYRSPRYLGTPIALAI